jgi:hypothetical protein
LLVLPSTRPPQCPSQWGRLCPPALYPSEGLLSLRGAVFLSDSQWVACSLKQGENRSSWSAFWHATQRLPHDGCLINTHWMRWVLLKISEHITVTPDFRY